MRRKINILKPVSDQSILTLLDQLKTDIGIKKQIGIRMVDKNDGFSPMVTGLFHPTILLPPYLLHDTDKSKLEPILLHELIHIKRGDLWVNFLLSIIQMIYFYHPVVWITNNKIVSLSEDVCDDLAILFSGSSRKKYFQGLLIVLEKIKEKNHVFPAEAYCMERKSSLSKRIIRLTHPNYHYYRPLSKSALAAVVSIGLFSILLSCESVVGVIDENEIEQQVDNVPTVLKISEPVYLKLLDNDLYEIDGTEISITDLERVLKEKMIIKKTDRLVVTSDTSVSVQRLDKIHDTAYMVGYREITRRNIDIP